jgi:hypothetical protein
MAEGRRMKHRDIFEWDDDVMSDRDQFIDYYILDELHDAVDDLDLSQKTIEHLHKLICKAHRHLNHYLKKGERKEE